MAKTHSFAVTGPSCAYLAQSGRDADLWVVAHRTLFLAPPKPIARRGIAAVVIDESPWQAGLVGVDGRGIQIPLDWLDRRALPTSPGLDGERLVDIRQRLAMALGEAFDGPVSREALEAIGFNDETGRVARKLEWTRKANSGPWRERIANATLAPMAALWQAVEALMVPGGSERSGWLRVDWNDDRVRVVRVTGRRDIADAWRVPTLLVDAVLNVELVKPYWPTVEAKPGLKVRAPHQTIRQMTPRAFAKRGLAADNASGDRARRKLRAQILRRVRELGAEGRTLVVSNKSVVDRLDLPVGLVETAHFNAIAGRDQWRNARLVVIVGRPMPRPSDVERLAAALTGAAVATIPDFYDRGETFRLKRTTHGIERIPAQRDAHPDPTADRILQHILTGELTQAIGRGRGVRRTADNPVEVLVFGDAILAEPVDEFLTDNDLAVTPADMMLAAGGVAFDDGANAARAYPELWRNAEAAKKALQRGGISGTKPYGEYLYGNVPLMRFRRVGAHVHLEAARYDPRQVPDPRAEVERLVGPLAFFELVGEAEAPPVKPRAPAEAITVKPEAIILPRVPPEPDGIVEADGIVIDWAFVRARAADCEARLGDLARAAGISHAHFRNMQTGFRKPTPEVAAALERFFATTPAKQGRLL